MDETHYTSLSDRGVISISGSDSLAFLQGIVTNDVEGVSSKQFIYAAILTPQGKYLHDFFITKFGCNFLLDCPANQISELIKRLKMYRLRAKVEIEDQSKNFSVLSIVKAGPKNDITISDAPGSAAKYRDGVAFVDPRLTELGIRVIIPGSSAEDLFQNTDLKSKKLDCYKSVLCSLGVPDGNSYEILRQAFPMEIGFDELNAISFDKGCYVGQEVTIRMKIRKLIKKRLVPFTFHGIIPTLGSKIQANGKDVGQVFAAENEVGIAMLRLETLDQVLNRGVELLAEGTLIKAVKPSWVEIPV